MISVAVKNGFVVFLIETDYSREDIPLCGFAISAIESVAFFDDRVEVYLGISFSAAKASLKSVIFSEDIDVKILALLEAGKCQLIVSGDAANQFKQALFQ